ncbi:MAG: hypothetical protein JNK12_20480 [Acidimicrobiales bacterium]|nr:hypothetical protein [Acidimicrobiales bacterium]
MTRLWVVVAVVLAAVVALASPAAAHGGPGGDDPGGTNFRTRILEVTPDVDGLEIRVIEAGARVELVNDTGEEIIVRGYEDEPFLRVNDDGVFENLRSPATYLNRSRQASSEIPPEADADAAPDWQRLDSGQVARWHDHRAHWMGGDPPAVVEEPGAEHVVIPSWMIPIDVGRDRVEVSGDLVWVPGPPPWPHYLLALGLAVGLTLAGLTSRWRWAVTAGVVLLIVAAGIDAVGVWTETSEPTVAKLGGLGAPLTTTAIAIVSITQLRRAPREALIFAAASATSFGLLFGISNLDWLSRSQLPTTLSPTLARLTVTVSLGAAAGILGLTAVRFPKLERLPRPSRPTPARATPPHTGDAKRHRKVFLLVLGSVVAASFGIAALSFDGEEPPSTATASAVHEAVCDALREARAGDAGAASRTFTNGAHEGLHQLAADTSDQDRAAAAELLEAKQAVESALIGPAGQLATDLEELAPTVRRALDVTDADPPTACAEEADTP